MEIIDINCFNKDLKLKYINECLNIYNYYILNTSYSLETEELDIKEFIERVNKFSNLLFLAAVDNNHVVGYAYLDKFSTRQAYYPTVDLSIYVDNNVKHKGIGSLLLNNIINIAKEKGYKNIISIITSVNEGSLLFHKKNGFIQCGYLDNVAHKFNQDIGIYYYKRGL